MKTPYKRQVVLTEKPIGGYYEFENRFRLVVADEAAPRPPQLLGHHPAIIEYRLDLQVENDRPQETASDGSPIPEIFLKAGQRAAIVDEICVLLTCFTKSRFFSYRSDQAWFAATEAGKAVSRWGQTFYSYQGFDADVWSEALGQPMPFVDATAYYREIGSPIGQPLDLPSILDELFASYYSLDSDAAETYLAACKLFGLGHEAWSMSKSLSYIALVSSLEALIHFEHKDEKIERCSICEQPKYAVGRKFREFLDSHVTHGFPKKEANRLYQIRCGIVHRGQLLLADNLLSTLLDSETYLERQTHETVMKAAQVCLVTWLLRHSSPEPPHAAEPA